tara:strand:+ start:45199 stop:45906 length:708 start_codon:yes stop_codon:yes gene_type:complete
MDRLVAFGCSNTYGEGLPDCWIDENGNPSLTKVGQHGPKPSKFAWPRLIADNLKRKCVNFAVPGASNKHILDIILHTKFVKGDIVVIMWSYFDRYCVFQGLNRANWRGGAIQRFMPMDLQKVGTNRIPPQGTNISKSLAYYEHIHNDVDACYDSIVRMNMAKYHLDAIGIKNYHVTCEGEHIEKIPHFNWNRVNLYQVTTKSFFVDMARDSLHPGRGSHMVAARDIQDFMRKSSI